MDFGVAVFQFGISEIGNGMEGIGNIPGCPDEISFGKG
jgi:hypothetical protein